MVRVRQYKQCKRQYIALLCVSMYRRCIGIQVVCSAIVLTAHGLLRGVPEVPVRAGGHHVVEDEPLVIVRRQGRLPDDDGEETVIVCWANGVHRVSHPTLTQQTGAVEIVFEVSVPHVPSHALRRLLLRVRQQDAVHLGPQADELVDGPTGRLVLEFSEDLLVGQREIRMTGRVVAGVEQVGVASHVRVYVGGLDLVTEGVSVRKEHSGSITVLALDVVVVKFVH